MKKIDYYLEHDGNFTSGQFISQAKTPTALRIHLFNEIKEKLSDSITNNIQDKLLEVFNNDSKKIFNSDKTFELEIQEPFKLNLKIAQFGAFKPKKIKP